MLVINHNETTNCMSLQWPVPQTCPWQLIVYIYALTLVLLWWMLCNGNTSRTSLIYTVHIQLVVHHVHRYYRHCVTSCPTRSEYYMVVSLPEVFLGHDLQKDMIDGLHSLYDTKLESIEALTAYHFDYIKGRDYILPSKVQKPESSKL